MNEHREHKPALTRRDPLPEYVAATKGSAVYQVHTYPTKIPPQAIIPFIEASTEAGGVVADPFAGSGMTGVASLLSGRSAVLSDLSPGAVHLARNHTRRVEPLRLREAVAELDRRWMRQAEQDLYRATIGSGISGLARHTIWSEIYLCPACREPVALWEVSEPDAPLLREIACPRCRTWFDRTSVRPAGSRAVHIVVKPDQGGRLVGGPPTEETSARLDQISRRSVRYWVPETPIEVHREMYIRSALHLRGIRSVADFFTTRPKLVLSRLWHEISAIKETDLREALQFAFTNTAWHSSRMRRFNAKGGQRPLTGTLFIPQLVSEPNVCQVFRSQVEQICRYYEHLPDDGSRADVHCGSATNLGWLADGSVDYVFTDPPFGSNLFYADCNIVWESWLGDVTDHDAEIVVNRSRPVDKGGKTVADYQRLLTDAFKEIRRVLEPSGRCSVVFHNSNDAVWTALLDAVEAARLYQAEVSILDKGQRSQKGYKIRRGELVPFYDLVITFTSARRDAPARLNGVAEAALDIVKGHLAGLNGDDVPARRRLDYLYSVAIGGLIRNGTRPAGLSLRAFEHLCNTNLDRVGDRYYLPLGRP